VKQVEEEAPPAVAVDEPMMREGADNLAQEQLLQKDLAQEQLAAGIEPEIGKARLQKETWPMCTGSILCTVFVPYIKNQRLKS
jgi:hypothetical protein